MTTGRSLPEWVGATPDTRPPPRVRIRIFERDDGRCHISGRKIMPGDAWDLDHIVALVNGGENRETNLAPALRDKHREKTAKDAEEKSRIAARRASHLGIRPTGGPQIVSRGFAKAPPQRRASSPLAKTCNRFERPETPNV